MQNGRIEMSVLLAASRTCDCRVTSSAREFNRWNGKGEKCTVTYVLNVQGVRFSTEKEVQRWGKKQTKR
jgi:hypothetical protein